MLQLVRLNEEYKNQLHELMDEWTAANEKIVPFAIRKNDYHDFQNYVNNGDRLENEIMHNGTFIQRYWIQTADV